MNTLLYEDISVGSKYSFSVEIEAYMLDMFKKISGDVNPLHCKEDYAKAKNYKGRVVYGMLTATFYSTLAGVYIPGKNCLLHSVDTKFVKPVYIGDKLLVEGTVTEKNDTFKQITIKAVIKNQNDEKVSRAVIKAGVQDDE